MPLPLAPVAGIALRYGTVALATYAIARRANPGRRDQKAEDAFDNLDEGITVRRDDGQADATGRLNRIIRFGVHGPGVEIDISAFGRIRIKRIS